MSLKMKKMIFKFSPQLSKTLARFATKWFNNLYRSRNCAHLFQLSPLRMRISSHQPSDAERIDTSNRIHRVVFVFWYFFPVPQRSPGQGPLPTCLSISKWCGETCPEITPLCFFQILQKENIEMSKQLSWVGQSTTPNPNLPQGI